MDIKQINAAIISGIYTNDDLNSIVDALKYARAQLSKQNRRALMPGDTVKFTSSKHGCQVTGVVEKVAIKFVTVRATSGISGMWKVPANMLTLVES